MPGPLVLIGGGGFGRCVLDLVDAVNLAGSGPGIEVVGVIDEDPSVGELLGARGVELLGPIGALASLAADVGYVIGIADGGVRRRLDAALRSSGRPCPTIVHPNVHVGFDVRLGPGTVVASHVSFENHVRLGRHVHVNQNSTVGHDSVLGDYTTVSPLVAVSGAVTTGSGAFLGTGASIRQGVRVGADAVVGMGAAVITDVAPGRTVVGVPARVLR